MDRNGDSMVEDWGAHLEQDEGNENDNRITEEDLIMEVHARPILWDAARKDYRDKPKRDAAWQEIGRNLKREAAGCSARWKNLRERYGRLLKKQQKLDGSEMDLEKEWDLAKSLSFLRNYIKPRHMTRFSKSFQSTSTSQDVPDKNFSPEIPETENCIFLEAPPPHVQQVLDGATMVFSADQNNFTTRICEELSDTRKTMVTIVDALKKQQQQPQLPPKELRRIDGLFILISDRYMALRSDLQNEFDIVVQQTLNMLVKRQQQ